MKLIQATANVFDDIVYLCITTKVVDDDSGDLTNYSFVTLRFSSLSRALRYVEQMARVIVDTDYHMQIDIVRVPSSLCLSSKL